MYGWLRFLCILGTVLSVLQYVWTGGLWRYAQAICCRLILIVPFLLSGFILCQASATIAAMTTPPVTVLCSSTLSHITTVTMAPTLKGPPATLGEHDVILPPLLILRDTRGVFGLATVLQQQLISELSLPLISLYVLVSVLVYASIFQMPC